ncbi:hypothetical protein J437_LFUL005320 [Ladona fulva]|uniref:5'-3' exoribonuclease 1 n=1 Tax=Ladona fulva TaxID=123851 RepID=A0A8K0NWP7_LADFU|nr:hypothetical protein J437_LFUL005320 [Ladona fulva]
MGVPKFFRWLAERYPSLCELVREYQIPEFDNLYLDMNGIIHICSHPNDFDPQFRITEEQIFRDIFHYLEIIFRLIQPRKLFFMAVDGVAPRAKLNQQRGRRFRSAKEAADLEKKARDSGLQIPEEERFDSNCITPGTAFMERLHHQLRYFVADKMSNDKLWKNVKVILSGHETPGEGEHKIMDYIRYMKSQPDYDNNTRHCLYGLDADLLMLGTKFYLLHLSLLRDYLDWEFHSLKDKLPFGYDIEKIIDDWVLMGFLVGNDFIPHLPGLHIANGALPILHKAYMDILPSLGGYINEAGFLNLSRFQQYMEKLAALDIRQFKDEYAELKYFEGKTNRKMGSSKERPKAKSWLGQLQELSLSNHNNEENLEELFGGIEDDFSEEEEDDDDDEDEPPNAEMYQEFYQKKRDYYTNKLEFEKVTPEVLRSQAEGYVRAIQWNLNYYYNGVCSWSWFYPHHYAPYISDIKNFCNLEIKFELGEPFLPFQQLLAVMPSLSKNLLPKAFHSLMVDGNSPIIDYYPSTFQTDLNGKRQEWEAVVLIPFIDEERLLKAMEPLQEGLTEEERKRNKHGPMLAYTYSTKCVEPFRAPHFPPVLHNHALEKKVMREEIYVPIEKLQKGLCSNVDLESYFPGFPSLRHASLQKGKVKVFEYVTRGDSIILEIQEDLIEYWKKDTMELAKELLGKCFLVGWPHLIQAKIIEVLDSNDKKYSLNKLDNSKVKENDKGKESDDVNVKVEHAPEWKLMLRSINENYFTHLGIQLGDVNVIVRALPMAGYKYRFTAEKLFMEKQWAEVPESYALQTVVKNVKLAGEGVEDTLSIHELFLPETVIFHLGAPYYGYKGQVVEIIPGNPGMLPKLRIALTLEPEPKMLKVRAKLERIGMKYLPGVIAAQRIGISSHLVSRITGTIYINQNDGSGKSTNIGLSLKFNKRRQEVPGFTKKDDNVWLYSERCIELLNNYIRKFPKLFKYLSEHADRNDFEESEVFTEGENVTLKDVVDWLADQPHSKIELRTCGAEVLEQEAVREIEKEVEETTSGKESKTVTINVQPHHVFKPNTRLGHLQPDRSTKYSLFDRVVNVRESYTVPLGLRGTVIGIQRAAKEEDTVYDVVFDCIFAGGMQILGCTPGKGYRLPSYAMINLTHYERSHGINDMSVKNFQSVANNRSPGNTPLKIQKHTKYSPTLGGYRGPNAASKDASASAFASWPSAPPTALVVGNRRNHPEPEANSIFHGKDPVILKRPPTDQVLQPPDTSQYQAIWNELKTKDSGTVVLKKILKIDDSPISSSQSTLPKAENTPVVTSKAEATTPSTSSEKISQPSVQEFFEKAKAVSAKQKSSPRYCVQLISLFQRFGIPQYDYVELEDGRVAASLSLPNRTTFNGEPSYDRAQASENAAKIALARMSEQDLRMPMPASNLPAPPHQWYQPQMQQQQHGHYQQFCNQQHWQNSPNPYQKLNWRENPDLKPDWRARHVTPWHGNRPPPASFSPFGQQRYMPPFSVPPHPNHPVMQRPNANFKTKPMWPHHLQQAKPFNEFPVGMNGPAAPKTIVPIQALRAQTIANSQQVAAPMHHKQVKPSEVKTESNKPYPNDQRKMTDKGKFVQEVAHSKVENLKKEVVKQDATNVLTSHGSREADQRQLANEDGDQKSRNREVKKGKEIYVPPKVRKSRLAIKFGASEPQATEEERS